MAGPQEPRVIVRGPGEGDGIILPMGGRQAHITRKASRTETGGHWAFGGDSREAMSRLLGGPIYRRSRSEA